jgi:hypothetical protein
VTLKLYKPAGMTVEVLDREEPSPDTTPPDTVLVSGPVDGASTDATITFTGSDPGGGAVTFEGSLDGAAWAPVVSPVQLTGLAPGAHSYRVQAVDAAGNIDAVPAVVNWTVSTPPPTSLVLVRKSPSNTGVEYGGFNFQFNTGCMIGGGQLHHIWRGTWRFNTLTGAAAKQTCTNSDGSAVVTLPENCDQEYVETLGLVFETTGAPVGAFRSFDPATNVYTILPGPAQEGDVLLLFDRPRNRLLTVAGYTPPTDVRAYALPSGPWTSVPTTNAPAATFDYAKVSMFRGGISLLGRVGFFGDYNELSELEGGATNWVARPTTGTKPSVYSHFVYYEPHDAYYAWTGAAVIAGANAPSVRKFYRLRRATWAWEELAVEFPAVGAPTSRSMIQNILIADPENEQLVLMVGDGYVRLYTMDLRGSL